MVASLIFKCTEGQASGIIALGGGGMKNIFLTSSIHPCLPSSFDTHARWQPVMQSAQSRQSYGKIGDCEQSSKQPTKPKTLSEFCLDKTKFCYFIKQYKLVL